MDSAVRIPASAGTTWRSSILILAQSVSSDSNGRMGSAQQDPSRSSRDVIAEASNQASRNYGFALSARRGMTECCRQDGLRSALRSCGPCPGSRRLGGRPGLEIDDAGDGKTLFVGLARGDELFDMLRQRAT